MINLKILILSVLAVLMMSTASVAGVDGIKDRMRARLDQINVLKAQGNVGENNQGYLEVMAGAQNGAKIVKAENKDRKIVYVAVAKKHKTTAALVGQRRAETISKKAKSGVMVQGSDGTWRKK